MSNLKLNCFVLGDELNCIFPVDIAQTQTVGDLKKLIKEEQKHTFRDVDVKHLKLWQVDLPVDQTLERSLKNLTLDTKQSLSPVAKLIKVFSKNLLDEEHLHIVVETPHVASSGPLHLKLNCFVLGDEPSRIFEIKIASTESVSALQKVIKDEKKHTFHDVDADSLNLWKVTINSNDLHLLNSLEDEGGIKGGVKLNPMTRLSKVFTDGMKDEHIHIIVLPLTGTRGRSVEDPMDIMVELHKRFKNTLRLGSTGNTPSEAAKSSEYRKRQGGAGKIYDCRSAQNDPAVTIAPPIQLFNPAFAYFSSKAFDPSYEVPHDTLRDVQNLMTGFATIHSNENVRKSKITSLMQKVLGQPIVTASIADGKCAPDGLVLSSHAHMPIYLIVIEEKNELGDGHSDPSVQASFSFLRISSERSEVTLRSNRPAFLLAHAGPWLAVLGAVLTDNCIVQRLTDYIWIPTHSALDVEQFRRIGRVLYALRESVVRLKDWYDDVFKRDEPSFNPETSHFVPHSRFFPSPDIYIRDGNSPVRFIYQRPLELNPSCVTYLAKTVEDEPINVVVKFVTRYGEDAHKAMAEKGFAPKLLYYGPINIAPHMPSYGSLRMVVMEYVDGTTAFNAPKLPPNLQQDLTTAIDYCHEKGFVFGDLRQPNVMITKDNKVQLIDFDWAGREGEVTYPVSISPNINWPKGVRGLDHILKQHDRDMLVHYHN